VTLAVKKRYEILFEIARLNSTNKFVISSNETVCFCLCTIDVMKQAKHIKKHQSSIRKFKRVHTYLPLRRETTFVSIRNHRLSTMSRIKRLGNIQIKTGSKLYCLQKQIVDSYTCIIYINCIYRLLHFAPTGHSKHSLYPCIIQIKHNTSLNFRKLFFL
jgi:hypothetical protein